ncbi:hypothetical protein N1H47_00860 [Streptomyces noursei]|nr:hypothetical protein [Streptomyces noursei]UWS77517.1 hypothetical protein N1H47_00860 [Streptomyces noursei]
MRGELGGSVAEDAVEVVGRCLGRVVRTLAGDRVVEDDGVGHAEDVAAGGQAGNGVPDGPGVEPVAQHTAFVGESDVAVALVLVGEEPVEDFQ